MKRLVFTAIGIAAAVFAVKKLCYASDDRCDVCDDCDNCVERDICFADDEAEESPEKADAGEILDKNDIE